MSAPTTTPFKNLPPRVSTVMPLGQSRKDTVSQEQAMAEVTKGKIFKSKDLPIIAEALGSFTLPTGERRSARLALVAANAIPSDEDMENIETELLEKIAPGESPTDTTKLAGKPVDGGGKSRQRGGAETWAGWVSAKAAFTKSITLMTLYTFADVAKMAGTSPAAVGAKDAVVTYLTQELRPLGESGRKFVIIVGFLVEQVFIKTPITAVMFATAGLGYTANFIRYILDISNTKVRAVATDLLSDEKAAKAAAAALDSVKSVGTTAGVGVFVANQIGVLPLSAVLAAILFTLQVNLGTGGGRAYLVSGLYAWYNSQAEEDKTKFKNTAIQYGNSMKEAAKMSAADAKARAKDAAKALGPVLVKATAGGKNAFQSVVEAAASVAGSAKPEVPKDNLSAQTALEEGAPAAAIAAGAAEAPAAAPVAAPAAEAVEAVAANVRRRGRRLDPGAAPFPAAAASAAAMQTGEGRRKTRKGKSKRRVTRRNRGTKILGTPVFVY